MKKAKIIVLAGQSNAVGVGHVKCLSRNFSDEKIEEYLKGYSNIKIRYYSHDKRNDGFTTTKAGCTEIRKETIGPEVGIAEYLNVHFPDEEYFIVKFAVGGANLRCDFLSPSSGGYNYPDAFKEEYLDHISAFFNGKPRKAGWCYNGLVSVLQDSIADLKAKGFDPQIIGFCWMQGESDARTLKDVNNYKLFFRNFIQDFEKVFDGHLDDCVFVDAGIHTFWECYQEMNALKQEHAKTRSDFVYLDTIANGLTTKFEPVEEPDTAHFDSESVIRLGRLFIETILSGKEPV